MTRRAPSQYNWDKLEFDQTILTKHFTKLKSRDVDFVVVHHMTVKGIDASTNALDACYSIWQNRQASAHYGVQGTFVRQYVWDKDYAWAAGSSFGNLHGIHIEHTNSTVGPKWLVSLLTMKTGARLAAQIHFNEKLGRPTSNSNGTTGTLRQHESFTSTACPGPFLGGSQWLWYLKECQRQYDLIKKGAPAAPAPTPTKPKPPANDRPDDWFSHTGWNLGGFDTVGKGAATIAERIDEIAAEMKAINSDTYSIVELPTGQLAKFKRAIDKVGYEVGVFGQGRAVVVRKGMRTGRSAVYKYPERGPAKDDRYVAFLEVFPTGPNAALISAGHLEHRDGPEYDKVRVTQARQGIAKAERLGANWGIHPTRMVLFDDENSDGMVLRDAYEDEGFHDAFAGAWQADNEGIATLAGWSGNTTTGHRIDKTKLYGRRKARRAHVRKDAAGIADHLPVTTVVAVL